MRKVLFVFSPNGTSGFNEYTDISLYLSDITLVSFFVVFLLENKNVLLSINSWKDMFHVEHMKNSFYQNKNVPRGTLVSLIDLVWYKCSTWNKLAYILILPLPFLLWSTISIFWSENEMLAIYATTRLFFGYFLYLALNFMIVPRGTIEDLDKSQLENRQCSTWNNQTDFNNNQKLFHVEQSFSESKDDVLLVKDVPRGTVTNRWLALCMKCSTWNISNIVSSTLILGGFIQSVIAIGQFLSQSSLHLTFLWESQIAASQAGIAKIIFLDQVFIRSYGLFPHPNILAAFLVITILLSLWQLFLFDQKLFHVEQLAKRTKIVPRGTISLVVNLIFNASKNFRMKREMFHVEHAMIIMKIALVVQVFGFLLTFSKGAILSLLIALIYTFYKIVTMKFGASTTSNVPRGTISHSNFVDDTKCSTWNIWLDIQKLFHVEQFQNQIKIIILVGIIGIFGMMINWYSFLIQPVKERFFLQNLAISLFKEEPVYGSGIGQSVLLMQNFSTKILESWQFQPVHNLFFLIATELGIVGCLLFLLIIVGIGRRMFHVEHLKRSFGDRVGIYFFSAIGIILFITSIFDHYYWDIQQGQLLFWLMLGLMTSQVYTKHVLTNIK